MSEGLKDRELLSMGLTIAQKYADRTSTCCKVKVGACIVPQVNGVYDNSTTVFGSNHGIEHNCEKKGCLRRIKYGDDSKNHRLPSDCAAMHAEVDAITRAAKNGMNTNGALIWVTRYPCEACARAIVGAGIKTVIYGREEEVSPMTRDILEAGYCEVRHIKEWKYEDKNN